MINFLKKRKIPDELPEMPLIDPSEEIEEKHEDKEIIKNHLNAKEIELPEKSEKETLQNNKNCPNLETLEETEESFFTELQENLLKEVGDLNKLEKWYSDKFLPGDIVNEMREYWEDKKTSSIIKILGKNFQKKISEKISSLQTLEKEWQNIYFNLIEKEEQIKGQEKELKKMLKEFIELCKRRKIKK